MINTFQNKTFFITGGTGLVGSTIIKKLRESDIQIIAMVRKSSEKEKVDWLVQQGAKVFFGDLQDKESFKFQLATADIVVHTAAVIRGSDYEEINAIGTRNIVETMVELNIRRIIHISTVGVYGQSSSKEMDENTEPKPIGKYSVSKYHAELELLKYRDKLDITIFRPPYIIGYVHKDRYVIPSLYKLLSKKILPRIWRYNPKFGFVHARDIASATLLAGGMQSTPHLIYNLQSFAISYNEIISMRNNIFNTLSIKVPIPYTIGYIGAAIIDLFTKNKNQLRKRISMLKSDWTFSTKRINEDLHWESQYTHKNKLLVLLNKYHTLQNPENTEINDIKEITRI